MLILLAGFVFQSIATANDQRQYPPPGQLIDVEGYHLHVDVQGEDRGLPTVILDAASGSMSSEWGWVQSELAKVTRVAAFDRPGQGYSEAPPAPLTIEAYAQDVRELLDSVGISERYVLVAHSMGSLTSRAFAKLYPEGLVGIILIDPRDRDIITFSREIYEDANIESAEPSFIEQVMMPLAARLGIFRLINPYSAYIDQLPPEAAGRARALSASTHQWDGYIPDAMLGERAAALLAEGEQLAEIPVIVLSAGSADEAFPEGARERFTALHEEMARALSALGTHQVVEGANHYTIVTQLDYAQTVIDAVQTLLTTSP
jgi:pimeloyl-ACP methyl ester carboxylesterase